MLHCSLIHRFDFPFKLSLVSVILSFKHRGHQIFCDLRTELDRSNKALLSSLFETPDPVVHNLVLVSVVDDIHIEMIGSRIEIPWPDGETEHRGHRSEHRDRCAKHKASFVDASLDGCLSVVPLIRFGFTVARDRTDDTEGGLYRVAGGRHLDHVTDISECNLTDIYGLGFEVT